MEKPKVLLVEDDESLGFVVKDNLEFNGFDVDLQRDGLQAKAQFMKQQYHICVLDVMLPKLDGFALAQEIRSVNKDIPIIFLTAKSLKEDRLKGFKLGGDDYLTKPFSVEELILRMEVFLRRAKAVEGQKSQQLFHIGKYTLNFSNLQLEIDGQSRELTQREAELLKELITSKNNLVTREHLLTQVWGEYDYFKGRSMDVFISRLRKYLKDDPSLQLRNIHGVGFRLDDI
jgi:DNA-binding response OmpR family regulator